MAEEIHERNLIKGKNTAMGGGFYLASATLAVERFAFYAVKWLMTIMVAAAVAKGGLGMGKADAAKVSANLVAMTYITPLFGSILSDRFIGARYLIPVGMAVMGAGYFIGYKADSIAMINAMILVVSLGNGLFKSQIHAVTGRLFKDQKLLDKAFSTQYAIANIGSFLGTAMIGVLVMGRGYAFGFLVCALALFASALIFVLGGKCLGDTGKKPFKYDEKKEKEEKEEKVKRPLTSGEKKRVGAIVLVSFFSILFRVFWHLAYLPVYFHWAGENPAANWMVGSFTVPSSWFDALNSLCCIIMGPALGMYWAKRARSEKGDFNMFQKTAFGLLLLGIAYGIFAVADVARGEGQAGLLWIVAFGIVLSLGEMVFAPLGNAFISKYAPAHLLSTLMSVWVFAIFISAKTYGYLYEFTLQFPFAKTYFIIAAIITFGGILLAAFSPKLNRLVEDEK